MKKRKIIIIPVLLLAVVLLAFGYAYLTTTLTINGITDIDRNSWDVYFDNVQVTDGSVTGTQVIDEVEIIDDTTVEFHVNLKKPGDFYEFTVDAKNDGTIDAMIESISKKMNGVEITTLPAYLNYTVTYEDDLEIAENHLLAAESLETFKIRVEFKKNISASDLPSTAQELELTFGVEYVQADDNAEKVREIVYTAYDGKTIYLNQPIPNSVVPYQSFEDAIDAFEDSVGEDAWFCLKHIIINGNVSKTYITYRITNDLVSIYPNVNVGIYSLRGGIDESGLAIRPTFESNGQVILNSFGTQNTYIYDDLVAGYLDGTPTIQVNMWEDGNIEFYGGIINQYECSIGEEYSICQPKQI